MDDAQNIVYVQSQIVCANILAMGMVEENKRLTQNNQPLKYGIDDFEKLILEYGIHHNAVIGQILGR